jgi:beta-N-acetylhexosaminidase
MSPRPDASREVLKHFLLGFDGTSLPDELRALLEGGLAGVALYARNFTSVDELRALTREIREAAGGPVLIGIDQEGGTAFSLPEPFTQWPSPADLGRLDDPEVVARVAQAMALELRAVGVNLNFAPMLDLHVNPASPVTRGRSFGANPHRVARLGAAFIRGLWNEGGVLPCAKHFPGHGDATADPHEDLPVFHGDASRLDSRELVPFAAAIDAAAPCVMTAHIMLPRIDPAGPASLSRKMLQTVLRERMGFSGVILADDLGMGAIRKRYGVGEAAILSLHAGTDLVMLCHDQSLAGEAIGAVERAFSENGINEELWRESALRLQALKAMAAHAEDLAKQTPPHLVGSDSHRELSSGIRARLRGVPPTAMS